MSWLRMAWRWLLWRVKRQRSVLVSQRCRRSEDCVLDIDLGVGEHCGISYCCVHGTARLITDSFELTRWRRMIAARNQAVCHPGAHNGGKVGSWQRPNDREVEL